MRREPKRRRNDADHLVILAVEQDRLADQRRVRVEARAPERFRKDHDAVVAFPLLFRQESAAQDGFHAEEREEIVGNVDAPRIDSRLPSGGDIGTGCRASMRLLERRALLGPFASVHRVDQGTDR